MNTKKKGIKNIRAIKRIGLLAWCVLFACVDLAIGSYFPLIDPVTQKNSGWELVVSSNLVEAGAVSAPYVYSVSSSMVVLQLDKTFISNPSQNGFFEPIAVEFQKVSSNAVPTIVIEDEYIINDTGIVWFDYHMYLIVNTFSPQAGFNPNYLPDGRQLENVSYSVNSGYLGLPIRLNFVDGDGNGVPPLPPGDNLFKPGYLSGQIVIETDPALGVGSHFGLEEVPTVPEPATIMLLGFGSLVLLRKRYN